MAHRAVGGGEVGGRGCQGRLSEEGVSISTDGPV